MRIRRLDDTGSARIATVGPLVAVCVVASVGCAHHRADQYAYAPPYAPPVYPQPQVQMPAQPTAYATPPVAAMPAGALPAGTVVADSTAMTPGTVIPATGGDCPPCATSGMEGVVMPATMVEAGGQTPPCPPGP